MEQETKYTNPTFPDLSVEDFDALEGDHEFSKEYRREKRKMLKEYRRSMHTPVRRFYAKIAVTAAVLILIASVPIIAYSAANGEFFNRIWGSETKENIPSHKEIIYNEQRLPEEYTFPEREYVNIAPEMAEKLIGSHVLYERVVKKLGDTTLTILSTVHDGNAAIIEFTLERKGGVNAFEYSQLDNEYHGATFSHDPTFWFHFPRCAQNIFVDLKKSTKEMLHCYNYMIMDSDAYSGKKKGITMEVYEYPCTRGELFAADEETFNKYTENTKISKITVPFLAPVKNTEYVNAEGGIVSISPLAMKIDTHTGLGWLSEEEVNDQENVYYASINYKDNTKYIVIEHELQDRHSCDTKIDNSSGISFNAQKELVLVFNRLVEPDRIESITVNETRYTLK